MCCVAGGVALLWLSGFSGLLWVVRPVWMVLGFKIGRALLN